MWRWGGVSQKDIYFFKRRLEAHPISQGGYKILGESNREKGLATGSGRGGPGWGCALGQWAVLVLLLLGGVWGQGKQAMRLGCLGRGWERWREK